MWYKLNKIGKIKLVKDMYVINKYGNIKNKNTGYMYKQNNRKDGYRTVSLLLRDGGRKTFYVHRVVHDKFIGPISENNVINHKDLNRSNNHYSNLEQCTQKENIQYSIAKGSINNRGSNNSKNKLTDDMVIKICENLQNNPTFTIKQIIDMSGIPKKYISDDVVTKIKYGKLWSHISKDYTFIETRRSTMNTYSHLIDDITNLIQKGHSTREVATILNIDLHTRQDRQRFWKFVSRYR